MELLIEQVAMSKNISISAKYTLAKNGDIGIPAIWSLSTNFIFFLIKIIYKNTL